MNARWKQRLPLFVIAGLLVAAVVASSRLQPAHAEDKASKAAAGRYTVIETQGHNLLVTDNQENKLYFYATNKDEAVGAPLKLRASLDLAQVGKEEIKITTHNLEKIDKK